MKIRDIVLNAIAVGFIAGCGAASHHIAGTSGMMNIAAADHVSLKTDIVSDWAGQCKKTKDGYAQLFLHYGKSGEQSSYKKVCADAKCQESCAIAAQSRAKTGSKYTVESLSGSDIAYGAVHSRTKNYDIIISGDAMTRRNRFGKNAKVEYFTRVANNQRK